MEPTKKTRERVAEEIRVGLARKKMTQQKLAEKAGLTRLTLSRGLNGHRSFTIDELLAISQVLGIAFANFLPNEEDAA